MPFFLAFCHSAILASNIFLIALLLSHPQYELPRFVYFIPLHFATVTDYKNLKTARPYFLLAFVQNWKKELLALLSLYALV